MVDPLPKPVVSQLANAAIAIRDTIEAWSINWRKGETTIHAGKPTFRYLLEQGRMAPKSIITFQRIETSLHGFGKNVQADVTWIWFLVLPGRLQERVFNAHTLVDHAVRFVTASPWENLNSVAAASVNDGGTYVGDDGNYPATQASTSGSGTGAEFVVTLTGGEIIAVASVRKAGAGYEVGDTITLSVSGGPTETTAATLDVDAITECPFAKKPEGGVTEGRSLYTDMDERNGMSIWSIEWEQQVGLGPALIPDDPIGVPLDIIDITSEIDSTPNPDKIETQVT